MIAVRRSSGLALLVAALLVAPASSVGSDVLAPPQQVAGSPHSAQVDPAATSATAIATATVVVRTAPGELERLRAAVVAREIAIVSELSFIDALAVEVDAEQLDWLASHTAVTSVTYDHPAVLNGAATDDLLGDVWFEQTVGADQLWASGIDGTGVGIAVVDSGIGDHETLRGRVVQGHDASRERDGIDHHGHGTFLAGVAAGSGRGSPDGAWEGVAPGAHLVAVKVGSQEGIHLVNLLEGLQWIHFHRDEQDIDVVSLAFGTRSSQSYLVDPLNYAVQRLWADGLVVVVSAGNLGMEGPGGITKPGDDPFVITVGASDFNGTRDPGDDVVASFSSLGPTVADGIAKPDLLAPGRSLVGPVGPQSSVADNPAWHVADGWVRASGTSMSTAVAAGAAALLVQAHPEWTPGQVKGALLSSAAPGPVGDPNVDGHGRLDVAAAAAVQHPVDPNAGLVYGTGEGSVAETLAIEGLVAVEVRVRTCVWFLCLWTTVEVEVPAIDLPILDEVAYVLDWTVGSWSQTQWDGDQWQGDQWQGDQWQGDQWQGDQWQGDQWT